MLPEKVRNLQEFVRSFETTYFQGLEVQNVGSRFRIMPELLA